MAATDVPVNRTLLGVLTCVCAVLGIVTWMASPSQAPSLWTGALLRASLLLGAIWLALPTAYREAAWARVPLWQVAGWLLGLILVARSRIPFKVLIPTAIVGVAVWILLRPRPKTRPTRRT